MRILPLTLAVSLIGCLFCVPLQAQSTPSATTQAEDDQALDDAVAAELAMSVARSGDLDFPIQPSRGLTLALVSSSIHNSVIGWTHLTTPVIAYRFNQHFSMDLAIPAFLNVNSYVAVAAPAGQPANYQLKTLRAQVGDLTIAGRYNTFLKDTLAYSVSATMSLPTGADSYGLGNGQVTYNFNNRFDYFHKWASPFVELGIGDTTSLIDRDIQRRYTTVGHIAHFQSGLQFDLPKRASFTASAYENLPIGDQKIYQQVRRGRQVIQQAVGVGLAEDNGFDTVLELPFNKNLVVSGFYSRSRRLKYDTAGFTITLSVHNPFHHGSSF